MDIVRTLIIVEIIISVLLVISIVLQPKDSDAGVMFGGGFGNEVKRTKRGAELFLHNLTIFLTTAFAAIAIAIMLLEG